MHNILNELYKTNLKFRTTDSGIIEILDKQFTPIAAIFPVYETNEPMPHITPGLAQYLVDKGEIE